MAKKNEKPKAVSPDDVVAGLGLPPFDPSMFGAAAAPRAPIGAPEEFFTPAYQEQYQMPGERMRPDFTPWRDGDEGLPGTWDQNSKARLQRLMWAAGLYDESNPPIGGRWFPQDASALRKVLEYANYEGIDDISDAVQGFANAVSQSGGGRLGRGRAPSAPLVVRHANPESVRQVVRKTSMDLLGRRLSDEEEQRIISGFSAQDVAYQTGIHGAQTSTTGGAVTEPLTADEYVSSQLEGTAEAGDRRYLDAFERIMQSAVNPIVAAPRRTGQGGVE